MQSRSTLVLILLLLGALSLSCAAQTCTISVATDGTASLSNCSPFGNGTITFSPSNVPLPPPPPPPPPPTTPDNVYSSPTGQWVGPSSDGPATSPTATINTMSYLTPSSGSSRPATPATLSSTLSASKCGDTIQLSPGTYNLSSLSMSCDALHWLTIVGPSLSPEGTRTSPSNFSAPAVLNGPKLTGVLFAGSSFIRLEGIEWTRPVGAGPYFALADMAGSHDIIIDRVYWHGSPSDETRHGITLNNSYNIAIIDGYSADFKCYAGTGSCTDSQAISGGNNSITTYTGNFKIVNNRIEAAGEGIIFGGGPSVSTSCDAEIRLNLFTKNLLWMPPIGSTSVSGFPVVKNNLEFKNFCRAFVEENAFENVWGGFSQTGYQVLLSPKNPQGTAPTAQVHDIIVRGNWMRHSGGCMQITTTKADPSATSPATSSLGLWNLAIHDVVCEDVNSASSLYGAGGIMFQVTKTDNGPNAKFDSVVVDHITAVKGSKLILNVGSQQYASNVTWTNSIMDVGTVPTCGALSCQVHGTGSGTTDCSYNLSTPVSLFTACWQPFAFTGNVILGGWGKWPASTSLTTVTAASFVDYVGGDYHLKPASPFANQGANVDLALRALSHLK